jgi:hypothetical protein
MLTVEQLEPRDCPAGPVLLVPIPAQAAAVPPGITVVALPPPVVVNATITLQPRVQFRPVVALPVVLLVTRVVPIAVAVPIFLDGRPEPCPLFYVMEEQCNSIPG